MAEEKICGNLKLRKEGTEFVQDFSSWLIGNIVEKKLPTRASSLPRPSVLAFPVARHRSHGPHWVPISRVADVEEDGEHDWEEEDEEEEVDDYEPHIKHVAASVQPIQRKPKKNLDFSGWRELVKQAEGEGQEEKVLVNDRKPNLKKDSTLAEALDSTVAAVGIKQTDDFEQEEASNDNFNEDVSEEQGASEPSLETQIDADNRALLNQMSPGEIEEAQAEIMEKLKPEVLEMLRKRGQQKKFEKKPTSLSSRSHSHKDALKSDVHLEGEDVKRRITSHISSATTTIANSMHGLQESSGAKGKNLWNSWTERVEAVRTLRFTLDGNVVQNHSIKSLGTGSVPVCNHHNIDNCSCRDYLKSDGDPAAMGYTIKEAVALSRSMVPGQRVLALQLLSSVLDKALHEQQQGQVGCSMSVASNANDFVDWMAVWAYALGPEPGLALSIRMALDSNHNSVVMASVKVIHSILSCDMNEGFSDISEKLAASKNNLYTAPIFRSRPEVDFGYLHGGFWKYSTKPSNILPSDEAMVDPENEAGHTINDDLIVAGQDFAAGLVRMGILPTIQYLLETNLTAALEEGLISILIGLARHSPTCAGAIIKSPRLVKAVVDRFTNADALEVRPSKIKSVMLLKVLAEADQTFCAGFLVKGIFQTVTRPLGLHPLSLDNWIKSGKEYCKFTSALMIEQLRLWKVCVEYGYCISSFTDFFPTLCLWLSPPTFDKLIENNLLGEFTSISREAYRLVEALVRKLPNICSEAELKKQNMDFGDYNVETWCWSHASPIIELALKWMYWTNDLLTDIFDRHRSAKSKLAHQDILVSSFLWVLSAIMHMLSSVLKKIVQDDVSRLLWTGGFSHVSCEYVFKIGLAVVRSKFLSFSSKDDDLASQGEAFINELCQLRLHSDHEVSLSSVCCLHWLVQLLIVLDKTIQIAKKESCSLAEIDSFSREGRILEDGIITWSHYELRSVLITFMTCVCTRWCRMQTIETFGRGGPSPGVGMGWGASGGGFWSRFVLLQETEAWLLMGLLEILQVMHDKEGLVVEDMSFALQRINSVLSVCLSVTPRNTIIMEKALNFLLQTSVLKLFNHCISRLLLDRKIKLFEWQYKEDELQCFSRNLNSHFRKRWLSLKKSKVVDSNSNFDPRKNNGNFLGTIYEDPDSIDAISCDGRCTSLMMEWSHQRLPLPEHWFLSPISTIDNNKIARSDEGFELAKSGLFLLLGLEAISSLSCTEGQHAPVNDVPLVWKLHSLSVALLSGMELLQEDKSRDIYRTLQELYGQFLDQSRCVRSAKSCLNNDIDLLAEGGNRRVELLKFQSDIHETYSTFVEHLVEQFCAISYGDVIYSRQIAVYLHSAVEVSVRLAAWNALANAHLLELLPPLEKCFAAPEGYLAIEDNEAILEAYVKSWISGGLDKAAPQRSLAYTLALHHLSSFIFYSNADGKSLLRNKLVKSLLRDYSQKPHHEEMMVEFIWYNKTITCQEPERNDVSLVTLGVLQRRFRLIEEACEKNSTLLVEVEKLKLSASKKYPIALPKI